MMNVQDLATKLQAQIDASTPEELATLLFQLVTMKQDFDTDAKQKTWRRLFARISERLYLKTMTWGE
jgi:hypothetical protein